MQTNSYRAHTIVVLDDDRLWTDHLLNHLHQEWPHAAVELVGSESAFVAETSAWVDDPPAAFVLDMMVAWSNGTSAIPTEIAFLGYFESGLRCARRLVELEIAEPRQILFMTALPRAEVAGAEEYTFLRKSADLDLAVLDSFLRLNLVS